MDIHTALKYCCVQTVCRVNMKIKVSGPLHVLFLAHFESKVYLFSFRLLIHQNCQILNFRTHYLHEGHTTGFISI